MADDSILDNILGNKDKYDEENTLIWNVVDTPASALNGTGGGVDNHKR